MIKEFFRRLVGINLFFFISFQFFLNGRCFVVMYFEIYTTCIYYRASYHPYMKRPRVIEAHSDMLIFFRTEGRLCHLPICQRPFFIYPIYIPSHPIHKKFTFTLGLPSSIYIYIMRLLARFM